LFRYDAEPLPAPIFAMLEGSTRAFRRRYYACFHFSPLPPYAALRSIFTLPAYAATIFSMPPHDVAAAIA